MDLTATITPKSDQLNADDLLAGSKTIRITGIKSGTPDQPVWLSYEGDNGKPWKPCKSMRRVLVVGWGANGANYTGRRLTLVNDASVVFGGQKVGGIRISHMSHLSAPLTIALTTTRAQRKPYTVNVLEDERAPTHEELIEWLGEHATAALAFLTESGRLKEGQTLADLPEKNRAKIYRSQAFLDAAGITLSSSN